MKKETQQKNLLIGGLLAIVLIMAVGYAAFATQLNINGTANISNTWCMGFDSRNTSALAATAGVSGATVPTGSISFSGDTCATNYKTDATLSANFKQPGDKIVYTLTIANKSSIAAAIKSIKVENQNVTSNTTITKGNIKYTVEMPESTTLAVDATTTMKVTAEFQNDTNINNYTTGETQTLSVEINAEQDDGNGGFTPTGGGTPFTGTIYAYNPGTRHVEYDQDDEPFYVIDADKYSIGQTINENNVYTTDVSTLNSNVYLKHEVVDDVITASYVCFVYNNSEHCLRGSNTDTYYAANMQVLTDYRDYYGMGGYDYSTMTGCYFNNYYNNCHGGGNPEYSYIEVRPQSLTVRTVSNIQCETSLEQSCCYRM